MKDERPLQVGMLCYPGLTQLDLTGPYEVLSRFAAAGLLRGNRATCHWIFLSLLEPLGAIPTRERVVIDRNRITAAGVSAGIDCALRLVSLLCGQEATEAIQLQIEYDPQPPFNCSRLNN
jgi:putative intracellular protease/amidase